jgi:hypothetical protein
MPPAGFEPTISANEPPQTQTLDRAATGIDRIAVFLYGMIWPKDDKIWVEECCPAIFLYKYQ